MEFLNKITAFFKADPRRYLIVVAVAVLAALFLTACGEKPHPISFDALETQRAVANDNSKYNAQKWRAENGFEKLGLLTRGDSTQQTKCPQGDGWASVDLTDPVSKQAVVKLQCSTVSPNLGCIKADDFNARPVLAAQKDKCNAEIPTTLKKIEG